MASADLLGGAAPQTFIPPPSVAAAAAILQDQDTGQILYQKAPDARRPIASLTKVMTALVVMEREPDLSSLATVSEAAAGQIGAGLDLVPGERVDVRTLLYGLLLESANDAAVSLAEHVAGSEEAFAELMNRRATSLGLANTHFGGATGLDNAGYSTARELAVLYRKAYTWTVFADIVGASDLDATTASGRDLQIRTRNELLLTYPGTTGGKTGFTTPSGHCLIASAERSDRRLVTVLLGEPVPAFEDGATLLDHGFDRFRRVTLVREGEVVGRIAVDGQMVDAVSPRTVTRLIAENRVGTVERRFHPMDGLLLPVTAGQPIGDVDLVVAGRVVASLAARAARGLKAGSAPGSGGPAPPSSGPDGPLPLAGGIDDILAVLIRSLAGGFV
ncbi:MAG: D-alanyl-D-alanine carboxypeptidase [Actinobacteria bacterium]|nr:D-alanyl-D-alanine carboxypeptidase [Actinomycetota bacterium]